MAITDDLDLPPFLRITQAERTEAWKGRRLTKPKPMSSRTRRSRRESS